MRWMLVLALVACGGDDGDDQPPVGPVDTFTISGTIRYEDRPQQSSGRLGNEVPKPARGVLVSIVADSNQAMLGSTVADDNGAYSIEVTAPSNTQVHVQAATTSTETNRPIHVRRANNDLIHGFGGPTFGLATSTQDILVRSDAGAEAFNIFDTLVTVMDAIPVRFPGRSASQLEAFWHTGNADGTYYFNNGMFLLGEQEDNDGYDDTVIIHEAGHWIEDVIGRSDSPGGSHDGSPTNPTLAWSEGFATYFAMAITDKPIYADSNAGGGFASNGDTSNTQASINGGLAQLVSEDMVAEILWDLGDATASDDDGVAGTHDEVLAVEAFLKFHSLRNVGKSGVDLVDFLDGWFINHGLTTCAGVRQLIDVRHTFPYDYGSSAGACP